MNENECPILFHISSSYRPTTDISTSPILHCRKPCILTYIHFLHPSTSSSPFFSFFFFFLFLLLLLLSLSFSVYTTSRGGCTHISRGTLKNSRPSATLAALSLSLRVSEGWRAGALRVSPPHKSPAGPALHLARCTAFLQERGFGGRGRREMPAQV